MADAQTFEYPARSGKWWKRYAKNTRETRFAVIARHNDPAGVTKVFEAMLPWFMPEAAVTACADLGYEFVVPVNASSDATASVTYVAIAEGDGNHEPEDAVFGYYRWPKGTRLKVTEEVLD